MDIFGHSMTVLERSMDLHMDNQRIIAANLANQDTPGYTAQKLDFQASMENALRGVEDPEVVVPSATPARSLDGNNVDLEDELSAMTRNKTLYSLSSELMGAKFRQLTTILDAEHS